MFETTLLVLYFALMALAVRVIFQGLFTPTALPMIEAQPTGWADDEDWFWFKPDAA